MIPLDSTCIAAVEYLGFSRILRIQFCTGPKVYSYYDVPPSVYHGLLRATGSHGEYYHAHIAGRYREPGYAPPKSLKIGPSPFAGWAERSPFRSR